MRKALVCIASVTALALAPMASMADEVQQQLLQMQERMTSLEDRLQATSDQLEASNAAVARQQEIIQRSGIAEQRPGSSGLAAFLDTLEVGGWISGSYFYNFDDPDGRLLGGANSGNPTAPLGGSGFSHPFKPDANSFQLDQLWFELERPVGPENRAGFRADIVWGKSAELLNSGFVDGAAGSENDIDLYQGYIQYLAPIGSGVTFQFGKFATLIGSEVVQAPYNFNITRGNVYNLMQPITHTGVLASMDLGEGATFALGFANATRMNIDVDTDKDKAVLWSLGWGGDGISASFAGTYGSAEGSQGPGLRAGDHELILDLILGFDPSENFSAYVNVDFLNTDNGSFAGEVEGWGVSAAARLALSERLGIAMRAEWVDLDFDKDFPPAGGDLEIWGLTTTADYKLTEQLMVRAEVRYDKIGDDSNGNFKDAFLDSPPTTATPGVARPDEDDQLTAGVEVIYTF